MRHVSCLCKSWLSNIVLTKQLSGTKKLKNWKTVQTDNMHKNKWVKNSHSYTSPPKLSDSCMKEYIDCSPRYSEGPYICFPFIAWNHFSIFLRHPIKINEHCYQHEKVLVLSFVLSVILEYFWLAGYYNPCKLKAGRSEKPAKSQPANTCSKLTLEQGVKRLASFWFLYR